MTRLLAGLTTPDGLACDVVLPDRPGPVIVMRTPYGKSRHLAEAHGWARRGVAAVIQDVRGRHESPGTWRPYQHEREDGRTLIDWVRAQPWGDIRVISYGSSYAAFCALEVAEQVDGVVASVPALGRAETARGKLYSHVWWWSTYGDCRTERPGLLDARLAADPGALAHLPVTSIPERLGLDLPGFEPAWRAPYLEPHSAATPLLCVGGLYDPFLDAAIDLWRGWKGPAELVVGPWQHDLGLVHRDGNGDRPLRHREPVAGIVASWVLNDEPGHSARLAVEGSDGWTAGMAVNTLDLELAGGGRLTADPHDPFPSRMGPVDVGPDRQDSVVARTAPFTAPVTAAGRPRVIFSGEPGHWAVRLSEELPDGRAIQLGHAVGDGTELTLPTIVHRFEPGSLLRVELAAHHFPLHVRHPHTDDDLLTATRLRTVTREVDDVRLTLELP